jgi:CrcB protein
MNVALIGWVAVGGALGTLTRYFGMIGIGRWLGTDFPWAVFLINILGSIAIGVIAGLQALVLSNSETIRAFVVVGLLGGFTTFSSFSLDIWLLVERGQTATALIYAVGSVALGVSGLAIGLQAVRFFAA